MRLVTITLIETVNEMEALAYVGTSLEWDPYPNLATSVRTIVLLSDWIIALDVTLWEHDPPSAHKQVAPGRTATHQ